VQTKSPILELMKNSGSAEHDRDSVQAIQAWLKPSEPLSRFASSVIAEIGGQRADVLFAELAPGFVGIAQLNLKVPALAPRNHLLKVTINAGPSNSALVSVR
jgi:uncharacterized protein (TIGR03437 family)